MTTFRRGQKVVCVDADSSKDGWTFWHDGVTPLKNGDVYTVFRGNYIGDKGEDVIQIIEAKNPFGYFALRFRPLVERKTDISFAHEILRKTTRKDRVGA